MPASPDSHEEPRRPITRVPLTILTEDETKWIAANQDRCQHCGHLMIFHGGTGYKDHRILCMVGDCQCLNMREARPSEPKGICEMADEIRALQQQLREANAERCEAQQEAGRLRLWKTEMLQVENTWDVVQLARALGAPLGVECRRFIHTEVPRLIAALAKSEDDNAKLRDEVATIKGEQP